MNKKPEKDFQNAFAQLAQFMGCTLEEIPDYIPDGDGRGGYRKFKAKKRPFDAVLVTPLRVYCLEFKYQNGVCLPHQENTGRRIRKVNRVAYFVVRKKVLKKTGTIYTIEDDRKNVIFQTNDMHKLIKIFKEEDRGTGLKDKNGKEAFLNDNVKNEKNKIGKIKHGIWEVEDMNDCGSQEIYGYYIDYPVDKIKYPFKKEAENILYIENYEIVESSGI